MIGSIANTITGAIGPRLREPSTYVGVVTFLLNLAGYATLAPELAGPISVALSGAAGVVLVIIREARRAKAQP